MITLSHIHKTYSIKGQEITALKDINLSIASGEIFGVIGPSGAGKSTLIRCVNLLERPSSGKVIVADQELTALNIKQLRTARRNIGMIFQHFNLLTSRTVFQNIAFPLELAGKSKSEIEKIVAPLLELTHLVDKRNQYPNELSGGQKQRVAIARALANKPKVLLSDEATSALDPPTTHSILQLLKTINEQLGLTILLITHEMDVIKEICHRLAIIDHGSIVEQMPVIEFFSNPKSDIAKTFIRKKLEPHLPDNIQKRLVLQQQPDTNPLVCITFLGQTAQEPLLANLIQKFSLDINIFQANIEHIRNEIVGIMIVELSGNQENTQNGIQYLTSKGIHAEVIGYVKRDS